MARQLNLRHVAERRRGAGWNRRSSYLYRFACHLDRWPFLSHPGRSVTWSSYKEPATARYLSGIMSIIPGLMLVLPLSVLKFASRMLLACAELLKYFREIEASVSPCATV